MSRLSALSYFGEAAIGNRVEKVALVVAAVPEAIVVPFRIYGELRSNAHATRGSAR
jgi:hypothetical protein